MGSGVPGSAAVFCTLQNCFGGINLQCDVINCMRPCNVFDPLLNPYFIVVKWREVFWCTTYSVYVRSHTFFLL